MFQTSKSPPSMTSQAATCFPDLSLKISLPPAPVTGCISSSTTSSDLTQENTFNHHHNINTTSLGLDINTLSLQPQHHCYDHLPQIYGHDFKRRSKMVKCVRRIRAPRMRWTSTLHDHFVHAVHLLGGHQRATPKSVQELMNVKDLTLAHVKSHLQMYRTLKSTDKGAAGLLADQMQIINSKTPLSFLEVKGGISVSPPTPLQSQRRSWTSSLETNDSHCPMKENTSSDHCPSPITNESTKADEVDQVVMQQLSKRMKLRSNSSFVASKKLLNLEFTLGSTHKDHIF